mmetsp:Transcript_19791/g.41431  ORF Transcript_19791/g.41431 Transcript_19791/m.41431 type:complete len:244 (-) Transcript_19791:206-937(-)
MPPWPAGPQVPRESLVVLVLVVFLSLVVELLPLLVELLFLRLLLVFLLRLLLRLLGRRRLALHLDIRFRLGRGRLPRRILPALQLLRQQLGRQRLPLPRLRQFLAHAPRCRGERRGHCRHRGGVQEGGEEGVPSPEGGGGQEDGVVWGVCGPVFGGEGVVWGAVRAGGWDGGVGGGGEWKRREGERISGDGLGCLCWVWLRLESNHLFSVGVGLFNPPFMQSLVFDHRTDGRDDTRVTILCSF